MQGLSGRDADPIDVVVVSWNTRDLLDRCLASLAGERVVVVDNGSSDGSTELVRERHPDAMLIESGANLGFGAAANLGAAQGDADWLAIANADIAPLPGALRLLRETGRSDPRCGALAPQLLGPDGSAQHSVHAFPTLSTALLWSSGLHRVLRGAARSRCLPGHWRPQTPLQVDWAFGALLLVRRTAWDEIGGFDPAQWLYAEDLDLCWRLARAGWSTRYEPRSRVEHAIGAATAQAGWSEPAETRAQRAAYAWMLRRWGPLRMRAIAAVNVCGAAARLAGAALAARIAPERNAWRRARAAGYVRMHLTGLASRRRLAGD